MSARARYSTAPEVRNHSRRRHSPGRGPQYDRHAARVARDARRCKTSLSTSATRSSASSNTFPGQPVLARAVAVPVVDADANDFARGPQPDPRCACRPKNRSRARAARLTQSALSRLDAIDRRDGTHPVGQRIDPDREVVTLESPDVRADATRRSKGFANMTCARPTSSNQSQASGASRVGSNRLATARNAGRRTLPVQPGTLLPLPDIPGVPAPITEALALERLRARQR
jgi:hypothetical protein